MTWRFDPTDYEGGSAIYVSYPWGWSSRRVKKLTVARVTPTGRITARDAAGAPVLISSRGCVSGNDRASVCSTERAAEIRAAEQADMRWAAIRSAASSVEQAARDKDGQGLETAYAQLASAIEARRAETAQHGSVEDESAGPQDDVQSSNLDQSHA